MHQTPGSSPLPSRRPTGWSRARAAAQAGFTLLEVMVAIAIASFTVAALFALFSVQSRQLLRQDIDMEMNQSLRFATDMISRSVRMAGYGSGGWVYGALGPTAGAESEALPVIMPWDDPDGDAGPDAVTVTYMDPALVMDTSNQVIETWDTLTITFKPAFRGNALKLAQLNAGDLLMCSDYADPRGIRSYLWTITAVNATTGQVGVSPNDGYSDYAQWFTTNPNLTPIMTCSRAEVVTFYVDNDDDGVGAGTIENPVLMMSADQTWPDNDDVPLVDNIEDLQLEYCVDEGTMTADCLTAGSANWVTGRSINPGTDADNIWMVRIMLTVRSNRPDMRDAYPGQKLALSNGGAGAADNYFRRTMATEVAVRNLRLLAR
jgi:prepilin-type N-terminal cleavage/methylation domain-containing protein